ncbi:hypothetical protein LZ30DRAFT_736718 [Colletotrichum cereale]|nr:hypothetical protein LZ30DRAFT_736718 [Colletotrichum cereale]
MPRTKRKVVPNPNEVFVDIKAIKQSREVAERISFQAAKGIRNQEIEFESFQHEFLIEKQY